MAESIAHEGVSNQASPGIVNQPTITVVSFTRTDFATADVTDTLIETVRETILVSFTSLSVSSSPTTASLVPQSSSSNDILSTLSPASTLSTSTSSTTSVGPIIGGVVGGVVLVTLITIVVIIKRRRRRQAIQIPTVNPLLNNSHAAQDDIPSLKRPRSPDVTPGSTSTGASQSQSQTTPNHEPTPSQSVSLREVESAMQRQMEMMVSMISERMMAFESAQSLPDYSSRASE